MLTGGQGRMGRWDDADIPKLPDKVSTVQSVPQPLGCLRQWDESNAPGELPLIGSYLSLRPCPGMMETARPTHNLEAQGLVFLDLLVLPDSAGSGQVPRTMWTSLLVPRCSALLSRALVSSLFVLLGRRSWGQAGPGEDGPGGQLEDFLMLEDG